MNLVTLLGRLSRPAEQRLLPSGDRLVALEVTLSGPEGKDETVPVVWFDAPASVGILDAGRPVLVVGRVRRRFYRANGTTQSRTEVVAETVVPTSQAKRVTAALRAAASRLDDALTGALEPPA
jgi:single-stranded DNA-binding protein